MRDFIKYLEDRGFTRAHESEGLGALLGDGETDEPETLGAINLAAREKELNNLTFIVNCWYNS